MPTPNTARASALSISTQRGYWKDVLQYASLSIVNEASFGRSTPLPSIIGSTSHDQTRVRVVREGEGVPPHERWTPAPASLFITPISVTNTQTPHMWIRLSFQHLWKKEGLLLSSQWMKTHRNRNQANNRQKHHRYSGASS